MHITTIVSDDYTGNLCNGNTLSHKTEEVILMPSLRVPAHIYLTVPPQREKKISLLLYLIPDPTIYFFRDKRK